MYMYILLPEVTIVCSHAKHLQVHVHSGHHQQAVVFTGIPFIVLPDNLETGSNAAHYQSMPCARSTAWEYCIPSVTTPKSIPVYIRGINRS